MRALARIGWRASFQSPSAPRAAGRVGGTVTRGVQRSVSNGATTLDADIAARRRYNAALGSLTMNFSGRRIRESSSKNFLMAPLEPASASGAKRKTVVGTGATARPVLQFGKVKKGKFILDYRGPLSPLQAFGTCISAWGWLAK